MRLEPHLVHRLCRHNALLSGVSETPYHSKSRVRLHRKDRRGGEDYRQIAPEAKHIALEWHRPSRVLTVSTYAVNAGSEKPRRRGKGQPLSDRDRTQPSAGIFAKSQYIRNKLSPARNSFRDDASGKDFAGHFNVHYRCIHPAYRVKTPDPCGRQALTSGAGRRGQTQDFVLRLRDVLVHALARFFGVVLANGLDDVAVFLGRKFAVVVDVNGGIHDPLHQRACFGDRSYQHLVARQAGDADVKERVSFYEVQVTFQTVSTVGSFGPLRQFLQQRRIHRLSRRQFRRCTFHRSAVFVNVVEFLERDLADKIPTVRNNAQQALFLQTQRGLAHGGATRAVASRQVFLGQRLPRGVDTADDIPLQDLVNLIAELVASAGQVRGAGSPANDSRGHCSLRPIEKFIFGKCASRAAFPGAEQRQAPALQLTLTLETCQRAFLQSRPESEVYLRGRS